ncbi:AAA family ATPase, partial [Agromyces seonyuensis]|nr:AAA family ATPase [Agromyces seonyuensis]
MKIERVAIAGFGPYKHTQIVDFDEYAGEGIFLIGGKTGAGKSSILDAICFALYGSAPRYDGTEARLRSDHCGPDDETRVVLEFTAGDERYRVERTPEFQRPKKRGDGMTTAPASARLAIRRDETWEGLAEGARDVGLSIGTIVGLTKEQFLQVILLAQNRFQEFLLANSENRGKVLRSLFGTKRFEEYEQALAVRLKALGADVERSRVALGEIEAQAALALGDQVSGDDGVGATTGEAAPVHPRAIGDGSWIESGLVARQAELDGAAVEARDAEARFAESSKRHDVATATRREQQRRDAAAARLAVLEAEVEAIDAARDELARAGRAAAVQPFVAAAAAATLAFDDARETAGAAANAAAAFGLAEAGAERLAEVAAERFEQLGALRAGAEAEAVLGQSGAAVETARLLVVDAETAIGSVDARHRELPSLIDAAAAELARQTGLAAGGAGAETELTRARTARAAAAAAGTLQAELDAAEAAELQRGRERTAASAALDDLRDRRLRGYAAELAVELRDGDACAVCGATEHPRPAAHTEEPVTADDLDAAQGGLDRAEAAARAASERVGVLRTDV